MPYIGLCGICLERDATHEEWTEFGPVERNVLVKLIPVFANAGMATPTLDGVWHGVCNSCCDKTAPHKRAAV